MSCSCVASVLTVVSVSTQVPGIFTVYLVFIVYRELVSTMLSNVQHHASGVPNTTAAYCAHAHTQCHMYSRDSIGCHHSLYQYQILSSSIYTTVHVQWYSE